MRRSVPLFALVLRLAVAGQTARPPQPSAKEFLLENPAVLARFDSAGRLVELTNRSTTHTYIRQGRRAPWRLFYRTGHGYYRPGDALDLEIPPDKQEVQVGKDGNTLRLVYTHLVGASPAWGEFRLLDASFTVEVRLDEDELRWTCTITNRQPEIEITEVWCPWLESFDHLGRGSAADVLYWPEAAGRRIPNPRELLAHSSSPTLDLTYPWPASMQWFTLNNGQEGLYLASHDST